MSTLTIDRAAPAVRTAPPPVPTSRLVGLELRKMFDTRSGFWLMASIVITALIATAAIILFAPDDEIGYATFAASVGVPIAIVLPMVAILSVTSEWSQRSGLTTFTLVPHRHRVISAKAAAAVVAGVVSIGIALAVGAVGNVVGSALAGVDMTWDVTVSDTLYIVLANVLGMAMGFMLGVLIRNSAGAIVAYFVYSLVLPGLLGFLAASQEWFRDLQPWVDFYYAHTALFDAEMTGEQWAQLGTSGVMWLVVPLAVGLALVMRSEVK
jgi:ABC-2 type transport system permease protein